MRHGGRAGAPAIVRTIPGSVRMAVALAAALAFALGGATRESGALAPVSPVPAAQPVLGAPADLALLGSSPAEAAGEAWGYAGQGDGFSILRYTEASGAWRPVGAPLDSQGNPLSAFTPAPGPLAGRTTAAGGVAIVGQDEQGVGQMLVRDPGGAFHEAPTLTAEAPGGGASSPAALLKPGETLSAANGEGVLMTAVDLSGGHTGAFLVPLESATHLQEAVLFYDGTAWTREPLCATTGPACANPCNSPCATPGPGFKVLAIDASSPQNAWLLAKTGSGADGIVLFSRNTSGPAPVWERRSLGAAGSLGAEYAQAEPPLGGASVHVGTLTGVQSDPQLLTVTSQGVWVDGQLTIAVPGQPQQTQDFTLFYALEGASVAASWCDLPPEAPSSLSALCTHPLGAALPSGDYRSFAWSAGGPFGRRVITGLGSGASLSLRGEAFTRVLGSGGESGTQAGAAFASPEEGWLANRLGGPLTHLTTAPAPDRVQSWPVPFRRPLTAIAEQPGAVPGDLGAQALAVGEQGQVARYIPGQGWTPEALLNSSGTAQTPDLRAVAWPEPGRAYAVGSDGAMWLWRSETGLWEPDPARPPNLFLANFSGIAFDPGDPTRGYAIGQQGLLLGYGKTWTQEPLPPGLEQADFTSIAFAGREALVTYQVPDFSEGKREYHGGLLVNSGPGSGWSVESDPAFQGKLPVRVAGMPDGGAIVALDSGGVIERQGPGAAWQPSAAGRAQGYPVALAALREGGTLRAVVSIDFEAGELSNDLNIDEALRDPPPAGQAPVFTPAYPLPASGFLLRETADGWEDQEHQDYPKPNNTQILPHGQTGFDWPAQSDATLALALDPDGSQGWAVGGQTGEINVNVGAERVEAIQTAGVMRYPAGGAAPVGFSLSPEQTGGGNATFAIGGNAQCASACADLAQDQLGPDAWLANAIARAGQTPGVRAFLYSGARLAPALASATSAAGFQREENRYAELLAGAGGALASFAAPSASDLDRGGTLQSFDAAFAALGAPQGSSPAPAGIVPTSPASANAAYYSFDSTGAAGRVRVIVLDYSNASLGAVQQCWLAAQLGAAKAEGAPAIVVGNRDLNAAGGSANTAADATQVIPILVNGTPPPGCVTGVPAGGASAYFFDYPQASVSYPIVAGGAAIPTYGSGTLGYVTPPPRDDTQFLGSSGFLLAEVQVARRSPSTNRAPVAVRLIPDISDLALDATNGVLLRRSQPALFTALARRPHAGMFCEQAGESCAFEPDPYVPIPTTCQGSACAQAVLPYYTFSSSKPDVGDFVQPDPASPEGTTVLQGANGKPIADPHSGLFCAYNAGVTTVTVRAGGLAYSEQITVLPGSVEQPCGTTPLRNPPAPAQQAGLPAPLPAPAPTPALAPQGTLPPPPPPPALAPPLPPAHPSHPRPVVSPLPLAPAQLFPILPLLPPPAPNPARPTPPSGTAQVSQTVGVAEYEREEQGATEMVHHMVAYNPSPDQGPMPGWPLGLALVAAAACVGLRRARPRVVRVGPEP